MATSSFDTTFRINPDWGVKNLENAIRDYEKSGPVKAEYSGLPVSKPTKEMVENIMRYKKIGCRR